MKKEDLKISIIGAGVSGLIAALVLEKHGHSAHIFEAGDRIGGRVKTDIVDGYQLDHGFQVLLSAYPMAKKYLDFTSLSLQEFLPGAMIFHQGKQQVIGDPLRSGQLLFPTLFSGVANLSDKLKIYRLNNTLSKKSLADIFSSEEKSTQTYLSDLGFSAKVIDRFFRPFFSGIFLEHHLETSSRMFEYVYKMFGEGLAVLPKAGIGAIPEQLAAQLKHSKIHYNTPVINVRSGEITLAPDIVLDSHYTIIATEAHQLVHNLAGQSPVWKQCDTLYFEADTAIIDKPLIGLVADQGALINNIFFHNSLETAQKGDRELLSVTVVRPHELGEAQLVQHVVQDLERYCGITDLRFLKHYPIRKALPQLEDLQYTIAPTATQLMDRVFLAGDQLLNGSLNAAMTAGESAALGLLGKLGGNVFSDPMNLTIQQ